MTAEHLLDAIGLVDDGLIQEAEAYAAPKRRRNYGNWVAWAASFAVVLALGYGLTQFGAGSGGGAANGGGNSQTTAGASGMPSGSVEVNGGSAWADDSFVAGGDLPTSQEPMDPVPEGTEGYLAVVIGEVVYRNTGEVVRLFPDGSDLQYDIFRYDEESGEAISSPGLCYLMLEDGSIAVPWDFQQQGWMIFAPDPPPES